MYAGKIMGIPLRLNLFFLLLLAVYGGLGLLREALLVFVLVLMHEGGHILMAQSLGVQVKEIELLPFGGVAKLDNFFSVDPAAETKIALAGPATNLVLVAFVLMLQRLPFWQWDYSELFYQCNAAMAAVNLLPALPLDGGRVYRACLSRRAGYRPATERAAGLGRLIAVGMILCGLIVLYLGKFNLNLLLLGFFLYQAAGKEQGMAVYVFMRALAAKKEELNREGVLAAEHLAARGETTLKQVLQCLLPRRYHIVMLIGEDGDVVGTVTETELMEGLLEYGIDAPLACVAPPKKK